MHLYTNSYWTTILNCHLRRSCRSSDTVISQWFGFCKYCNRFPQCWTRSAIRSSLAAVLPPRWLACCMSFVAKLSSPVNGLDRGVVACSGRPLQYSFILTAQVAPGVNLTSNLGKLLLSDTFKLCSQIELKWVSASLVKFSYWRTAVSISKLHLALIVLSPNWTSVFNIGQNGVLFNVAFDLQIFIAS